ncbi:alpha/beta hydrolase [Epilithonimonas sp.]|uniref:alpha/beta hydrolase n=1 Tax=Epilithonimonas sp. TaxID=2894511 RepID=UPI00289FBDEF|nr:alpha/beta hydrolase [Epilithonimonas sp.]
MKWSISVILIFILSFTNAQKKLSETLNYKDVTYKIKDTTQQKLDIYLPQRSDKKSPVLVFVHGGGWAQGNKALKDDYYLSDFVLRLVKAGYAVVSINYTLLNENTHFPAPIEDTKEAIRWIRVNAGKYNFDSENIGVWGASAGAQIGLIAANTDDSQFSEHSDFPNYSAKVNYFIDYFGPSDMNKLFRTKAPGFVIFIFKLIFPKIYDIRNKLVFGFTGYDIKGQKDEAMNGLKIYSPITYINNSSVPTLMIHGTKDKIVPYSQSEILKEVLDKNNVKNELISIKKGNHGLNEDSDHELMFEKTFKFIKENTH